MNLLFGGYLLGVSIGIQIGTILIKNKKCNITPILSSQQNMNNTSTTKESSSSQ